MRFTRLKLENWRNFLSVDVPLWPRVFVVGPNASGWSARSWRAEVARGASPSLDRAVKALERLREP